MSLNGIASSSGDVMAGTGGQDRDGLLHAIAKRQEIELVHLFHHLLRRRVFTNEY